MTQKQTNPDFRDVLRIEECQERIAFHIIKLGEFQEQWDFAETIAEMQRALSYAYGSKVFFKDGTARDRVAFVQRTTAAIDALRHLPVLLDDVHQRHYPTT